MEDTRLARSDHRRRVKDVPMDEALPGVIGRVERYQDEGVQMFLPNGPLAVDDPPMFQDIFPPGGTTVGTQMKTSSIPSTTGGHSICALVKGERRNARNT